MWNNKKKIIIYLLGQEQSLHPDIPLLSIILYPAKQQQKSVKIKKNERKKKRKK